MMLWITLTILACGVSVLISIPLIRRFEIPSSREDQVIEFGRGQIAELERDIERDLIGEHEAKAARLEIERRILTAAKAESAKFTVLFARGRGLALAAVLGVVAFGAVWVYSIVGRPELPSKPFAGNTRVVAGASASSGQVPGLPTPAGGVEELIAGLVERLESDPSDAEGWRMLGWSYFNTERYSLAAGAYEKSVELEATDPDVLSAYGETLVRAQEGLVSDKALRAFDAALAINPVDPRARFFKGMALEQGGDPEGAIRLWLDILATAPENVEWLDGLRGRVQELAASIGYDLGDGLPAPANSSLAAKPTISGPTEADVAAAQEMAPEDRQAMIVAMVDRLAARLEDNPNDPEGWAKLIRSRMVLGDEAEAIAAYLKANEIFAGSPTDQAKLAAAAGDLGLLTD